MAGRAANELLSTQKSSDSGLQVVLHPLPILEISDFIVRAYQRGFNGAVVGALLGQHNGHELTIEHSFSCKSIKNADDFYELDQEWFRQRLDQMKLVHKSPMLDLVGWYSLVPKTGPTARHLPIHRQISAVNESAVLLGFHVEDILSPPPGDPLPITIYESIMEAEDSSAKEPQGEDSEMKDAEAPTKMVLRFRKLPYTTETGEAEMIAMQFIREVGATATSDSTEKHILEQFDKKIAVDDGKGKRRAVAYEDPNKSKKEATSAITTTTAATHTNPDANLTRAETEYMSALQAKYNAVKMLKSRLAIAIAYLQQLPPDFTSGKQTITKTTETKPSDQQQQQQQQQQYTTPSNTILRHIQALVTNAGLVAPPPLSSPTTTTTATATTSTLGAPSCSSTLARELQREANDVQLVGLISELVSSVSEVREAGKKFAVLEAARHARQGLSGRAGGGAAGLGGLDPGLGMGMGGVPPLL